jgi:aminopeptidase 2
MLATFVGKETFMNGVRQYLKRFIYGNATTYDLWQSISEASGRDIASMMHSWIHETGFPIVTVTDGVFKDDQVTLTLHQQRYLASEAIHSIDHEKDPIWWIPLNIVSSDGPKDIQPLIFNQRQATISFSVKHGSVWKLNGDAAGFYRVKYSHDLFNDLLSHLANHPTAFSSQDRINMISDAFALSSFGNLFTHLAIEMLEKLNKEENYWYSMIILIDYIVSYMKWLVSGQNYCPFRMFFHKHLKKS